MHFMRRMTAVSARDQAVTNEPARERFTAEEQLRWIGEASAEIRAGRYFTRDEMRDESIVDVPQRAPRA